MKKKRKKPAAAAEPPEPTAPAPPPIATSLKGAIADWKQRDITLPKAPQTQPRPAAKQPPPVVTLPPPGPSQPVVVTLSMDDRNALERAFAGVRPLTERRRGGPSETVVQASAMARSSEIEARARLDALVGGGGSVRVERQDEYVSGLRDGVAKPTLKRLRSAGVRPEAKLDLHGEHAADVATLVNKFVRMQHKKHLHVLLIIHGKGRHSEGGIGVLGDRVVAALSAGGPAPLVAAFTTAHEDHGGTGALIVELVP